MPHDSIWSFFVRQLASGDFGRVLELGSYHRFGGIRSMIETCGSVSSYVGLDLREGPGVDLTLPLEDSLRYFGESSFDSIICVEVLEHICDFRRAIRVIKSLLRSGGSVYLTTRSVGYPYHLAPRDYWRFESSDMVQIFSDFAIAEIENDPQFPGVFIVARKPTDWLPSQDRFGPIYSILAGKRIDFVPPDGYGRFRTRISPALDRLGVPLAREIASVVNRFVK